LGRGCSWYVPGALGERPTSASRDGRVRTLRCLSPALIAALALVFASCGEDPKPQSDNEPEGEYEVDVTVSKFPTAQRLAQTSDLIIGVENTGDEALPELAFTIQTNDGSAPTGSSLADGSFKVRLDDTSLANPSRPVWILENKYPREVGTPPPTGLTGGARAQTNTFGFGSLEPGDEMQIVWRVTPVMAGTYTLAYQVEAGLDGNARAVTADGGEVKGEFVVTITDKPPRATVDDAGNVVTEGDQQLEGDK